MDESRIAVGECPLVRGVLGDTAVATIIHFRDSRRSTDADREDRTLTWLVSSLLLALAIVLGAPTVGLVVAGIFFIGTLLAHLEHRPLRPAEFVAIATLHAVAVVLMAF